jgi:hypothetical protein
MIRWLALFLLLAGPASAASWCDVQLDHGAVGDGSTDDTAAVQACIDDMKAKSGGGTVYLPPPPALYCVPGGLVHTSGADVRYVSGAGAALSACGTDVVVLDEGVAYSRLDDLVVIGKGANYDTGTFGATKSAVVVDQNCVGCRLDHVQAYGGLHALQIQTSDAVLTDIVATQSYGTALVYVGHTTRLSGDWFVRTKFDQLWPVSYPGAPKTFSAWAPAHAYGVGAVVSLNGFYIQASQAGTSGGSAPALKNYGIAIADNTVVWQLVAPTTYYSVQLDTNASENQFVETDHTGPFTAGLGMTNTLGGTPPGYVTFTNGVIGQTVAQAFNLHDGHDVTIMGSRLGAGMVSGASSVLANANFTSGLVIKGNSFFTTGSDFAVLFGSGRGFVVEGNIFSAANLACIQLSNVTDAAVVGNVLGSACPAIAANGTTDYYTVVGNVTHGVAPSLSGSHKYAPTGGNP